MSQSTRKLKLQNVTLCIADCANPYLASLAIEKSLRVCDFHQVLFFTDKKINLDTPVEIIKIDKIDSIDSYNKFILKDIGGYISTDFVLLIQWDGYVLDASAWRPEFTNYDYVGARWHWHPEGKRVGNGGFSLRSKKLLDITSADSFPVLENIPEDVQICIAQSDYLMGAFQVRFAPENVAAQFSYERDEPNFPSFGFHGLFNMWRHCDDKEIAELVSHLHDRNVKTREFTELFLTYFQMRKFVPLFSTYRRARKCMAREQMRLQVDNLLNNAAMSGAIVNMCEHNAFR
jgi:hypothetical protein